MKPKYYYYITIGLGLILLFIIGGLFIYSKFIYKGTELKTPHTDKSATITETITEYTTPSEPEPPTETQTTTSETTISADQLQSQIDENESRLESQKLESESIAIEESLLESKRIEESVQASISESVEASIQESIRVSEEESRKATTTEPPAPTETQPPKETPAETTKAPKPKGKPKLSQSSITIKKGDTNSFISQAQGISVSNTTVSAMLDYNGVDFYTIGTYTAYFNAMDGSYSLPLTVNVVE